MKVGRLNLRPETFPPNWQALQIYAFYRFILSGALLIAIKYNFLLSLISNIDEPLFISTTQAYISFSIFSLVIAFFKKPAFFYQTHLTIFFDIIFLILLMHAGGGILSGIGILLIIVVAAHSILLPGRLSLLIAALASTALLTEQIFSQFTQAYPKIAYSQAGTLGATIFIISIGLQLVSEKAIKNQILAKERGLKLIAQEAKQAQDIKLASLGRLTANIAHELRNPLAVISHASQLLAESTALSQEDTYLINVIYEHCNRMNIVIRNVLSLSTHKKAKTQEIKLAEWLESFISEFHTPELKNNHININLNINPLNLCIIADPTQLRQILVNLFENGLRYACQKNNILLNKAILDIMVYPSENGTQIIIDIQDNGNGISIENAKHIFEPFFTTEASGSGLGLYIARELAEMNNAELIYVPSKSGCLFRLIFKKILGESTWNAHTH